MAGITEFDRKLLATGFCTGNVPNGRRKSENPAWEADMGMLDEILNSIQDSGAASDPGTQSAPGGSQGMSPSKRGKSRGVGMIIRFSRRRESDSLRACRCPRISMLCRLPN